MSSFTLISRYLAGNRLHCTCAIKWFVAYLNGNPNLFNRTSASCSSPTTLVQKKVALLNTSNLQCGENQIGETDILTAWSFLILKRFKPKITSVMIIISGSGCFSRRKSNISISKITVMFYSQSNQYLHFSTCLVRLHRFVLFTDCRFCSNVLCFFL